MWCRAHSLTNNVNHYGFVFDFYFKISIINMLAALIKIHFKKNKLIA